MSVGGGYETVLVGSRLNGGDRILNTMNSSRLNLVLGVVIVALLGVIGSLYSKLPADSQKASSAEKPQQISASKPEAPPKTEPESPAPAQVAALVPSDKAHTWETVESADYQQYIANLRAIGCPEETIHDIIRADVNKLFESRKAATREPFEYWKTGNLMAQLMDQDKIKAHTEMNKEKGELLKTLLGADAKLDDNLMAQMYNPMEQMLDFLPGEKQSQLMSKLQTWQAEAMKLVGGGSPDAGDLAELSKVRDKIEAELNVMLTPQEKRDYDLRLSNTAQSMRAGLGDFNPSKEEFEQIFDIRQAFDREHSVLGIPPADEAGRAARREAETAFKKEVENLLGPDRYKEFERAPRREYKLAVKLAERQGLEKSAAIEVYEMKGIAEGQAKAIRDNAELNAAQRSAALQAIHDETKASIIGVFGDDGFNAYNGDRGGRWIRGLTPKPN